MKTKLIPILKISKIENKLGVTLKRHDVTLGLDTASKTGYCIAKTDEDKLMLSVGFINIKSKDRNFKYTQIIKHLRNLIKQEYKVVIEDTYYSRNVWAFKMITFIGAMAFTLATLKKCEKIELIVASSARKRIGLKGNAKKPELVKAINELLGMNLENNDIVDAIILALNGLCDEEKKLI